jgi:ATP-dependent exoDNAse (exonuclease V) beta subunit
MAKSILEKDQDIRFPHFTVLKASAGSGKTYTLTARFVQFVLSDRIPRNRLKNILAITFSKNASKEMKGRVLLWLKSLYFGNEDALEEPPRIVTMDKERMKKEPGIICHDRNQSKPLHGREDGSEAELFSSDEGYYWRVYPFSG